MRAETGSESAALFNLGWERTSQWLRFFTALHRPADDAKALKVLILAFWVNVASRQVHEYRICRSWGSTVCADHSQMHVFSLAPALNLSSNCPLRVSQSHFKLSRPRLKSWSQTCSVSLSPSRWDLLSFPSCSSKRPSHPWLFLVKDPTHAICQQNQLAAPEKSTQPLTVLPLFSIAPLAEIIWLFLHIRWELLEDAGKWNIPHLPPWSFCSSYTVPCCSSKTERKDAPGGSVVKNPPADAGDTGSIPDPETSHIPRSN